MEGDRYLFVSGVPALEPARTYGRIVRGGRIHTQVARASGEQIRWDPTDRCPDVPQVDGYHILVISTPFGRSRSLDGVIQLEGGTVRLNEAKQGPKGLLDHQNQLFIVLTRSNPCVFVRQETSPSRYRTEPSVGWNPLEEERPILVRDGVPNAFGSGQSMNGNFGFFEGRDSPVPNPNQDVASLVNRSAGFVHHPSTQNNGTMQSDECCLGAPVDEFFMSKETRGLDMNHGVPRWIRRYAKACRSEPIGRHGRTPFLIEDNRISNESIVGIDDLQMNESRGGFDTDR